jgi:hypothetical protein
MRRIRCAPSPSELGFTRVRHCSLAEVGNIRLRHSGLPEFGVVTLVEVGNIRLSPGEVKTEGSPLLRSLPFVKHVLGLRQLVFHVCDELRIVQIRRTLCGLVIRVLGAG